MEVPVLLGGLFLLNVLLLVPRWWLAGGIGPPWVALEVLLVVGLLALLPARRSSRALAASLAFLLTFVTVLALADTAARLSLARPLNLYLDLRLAPSVLHLLAGTLGAGRSALLLIVGTLGAGVLVAGLAATLARLPAGRSGWWRRIPALGLIALFTLGLFGASHPAVSGKVTHPVIDLAREQAGLLSMMLAERERFAAEMEATPSSYGDLPGLLTGLGGRDVVLAFVESYGMSVLEDPRYSGVVSPRLDQLEEVLAASGLHVATAALEAPSQGGQSWLGHGAVLSGLWLDNQLRYDLLLASDRETLVDDFRHAGYRTIALMPAITLAWPEGERFGYDRIYAHRDIDYRGPPLNWVTMPDQFTWHFFENTVRPEADSGPLFAELALISSHAPWTPILPVLDWEGIGAGEVFDPWAHAGERPEELWLDYDRVREHFALSVDYALAAMTSYAEQYLDDRTLLIVLGDHQPAPLITGEGAGREVPVHVIAGDPELLRPFLHWGFVPGTCPGAHQPPRRMDQFRDFFVRAFTSVHPWTRIDAT